MSAAAPASSTSRLALPAWLGLIALALAMIYAPTFLILWPQWGKDPNYSHGYVVLPFALLMAAVQYSGKPGSGATGLGVMYLLAGLIVHLPALVLAAPMLDFLSLVLVLRGLALVIGGRQWARQWTFPILFLFFMFPLPGTWTAWAALVLQDWVASISGAVLDVFVVCHRQGTSLFLAGVRQPLVVAEECSGLRQIVAFFALAAVLGQFIGRPGPRLLLLLAAIPAAVLANVMRVLLMGFGACYFGTGWIDSWLHHAPAAFALPVGAGLLGLLYWRLANPSEPASGGEGA